MNHEASLIVQQFADRIGAKPLSTLVLHSPEGKEALKEGKFSSSNHFAFENKFVRISYSKYPNGHIDTWWGFPKRIVRLLEPTPEDYLLFLIRKDLSGWVFAKEEARTWIRRNKWGHSNTNTDYKIHGRDFKEDLPNYFSSPEEFLAKRIPLPPEEDLTPIQRAAQHVAEALQILIELLEGRK